MRGNVGTAQFPGSRVVLDRSTMQLVECTPELCHDTAWVHPDKVNITASSFASSISGSGSVDLSGASADGDGGGSSSTTGTSSASAAAGRVIGSKHVQHVAVPLNRAPHSGMSTYLSVLNAFASEDYQRAMWTYALWGMSPEMNFKVGA